MPSLILDPARDQIVVTNPPFVTDKHRDISKYVGAVGNRAPENTVPNVMVPAVVVATLGIHSNVKLNGR